MSERPPPPRRPRRDATGSGLSALLFCAGLGLATVALPLVALLSGYSGVAVGVFASVSAVSQVGVRSFLAAAMRRWSDRSLIAVAGLLLAASNGLVALSTEVVPFLVAELLQGAARACFWTGAQTHVVRGRLTAVRALANLNLTSSLGILAGPAAAGVLIDHDPDLALWVAAVVSLLSFVPAMALDRLPPFTLPSEGRPRGGLRRRPAVRAGLLASGCEGSWRALLNSYVPVILDAARHSSSTIGILISAANAASIVSSVAVARVRPGRASLAVSLSIVAAGAGIAALAVTAEHAVPAAIALAVSGLGAGALQTMGPAMAATAVDTQEKGEAIAVTGTVRAAALLLVPLAVAGMVSVIPLVAAVTLSGGLLAVPAAAALRRRGGTEPQAAAG